MTTKIYIKIGGEWKEFGVSDFQQPKIERDIFEPIRCFGFIEMQDNIKQLSKQLRINPKLESWKGEGKRRMKVIK